MKQTQMRVTIGRAGWVLAEYEDRPSLKAYVRFERNDKGRFVMREVYVDGSERSSYLPIINVDMEKLDLELLEAFVNQGDEVEALNSMIDWPSAVLLSTMASYFQTSFGPGTKSEDNWVAAAQRSQHPDGKPVRKAKPRGTSVAPDTTFQLTQGPTEGITDEFLRDVARAYGAALARGERPNVAIAAQIETSVKNVERWVGKARDRGIMPQGRKGVAG
jgi:hypothetical protein